MCTLYLVTKSVGVCVCAHQQRHKSLRWWLLNKGTLRCSVALHRSLCLFTFALCSGVTCFNFFNWQLLRGCAHCWPRWQAPFSSLLLLVSCAGVRLLNSFWTAGHSWHLDSCAQRAEPTAVAGHWQTLIFSGCQGTFCEEREEQSELS